MADLVSSITDGVLQKTSSLTSDTANSNSLGKDAFLQLLVTQMKYQDPLNPSTDTEFVSQLATFSQLEQLQNLGTTMTNSQAFGLVGKDVIMKSEDSIGNTTYYSGTVDFVTVTNGKAYFSIAGKLYAAENLDTVIDENYMNQLPQVADTDISYNIADPKDATVKISLGFGNYSASKAIVSIDGNEINEEFIRIENGVMTIKKEAFADLKEGTYRVSVSFNNTIETTASNKVTVTVVNKPVEDTSGSDASKDSGSTT
ncbi:flagellar hook capping FlgD N-terminal domain-containing protein [Anaerosporobacter faecicola]|uniref:flagellar hook capping FlgD N-terminal domain-containing protein n=1 Tax=Anaerosporobacter faecicola TaxID=2718714 RepID=UPI00143ADF5E|nr:flagellar hook capping FlgD N-terminal domain-containing protein [Anaerosporobacter faecicola]